MQDLVDELAQKLIAQNMMIVTAESCTGGLLSGALTGKAGASQYFDRGFVTYSNEAKQEQLGVPTQIIEVHGAVSHETAEAMAKGALTNSNAQIAISITGIAGPDGGSTEKPVGTVYFGLAMTEKPAATIHNIFSGPREDIQNQSVEAALRSLIEVMEQNNEQ